MNRELQESILKELLNRFDRYIVYVIRIYFKGEDVKDIYQEVSMHIHRRIGELYEENPDLFSTKAWIKTVVKSFCISELRSKNGKRKIKLVYDELSVNNSRDFEDVDRDSESDRDINEAIKDFLRNLNKRDALILKMKYYYGKSSNHISQKMNEAHVNVYIQRIKERLIRRTGIDDIDGFVRKYNTYL